MLSLFCPTLYDDDNDDDSLPVLLYFGLRSFSAVAG